MTELTPKKIFIDCDETICHSPPPDAQGQRAYDQAKPWWDNIAKANRLYDQGHYIVYWTARGTQTGIDWKEVTQQQLIPLNISNSSNEENADDLMVKAIYDYEPDEETILKDLLPKNVSIQIFKVLLESDAGEHGARMAAMDNATRNAGEMIDGLTLKYNRTRQAFITKELIEIISGAESI